MYPTIRQKPGLADVVPHLPVHGGTGSAGQTAGPDSMLGRVMWKLRGCGEMGSSDRRRSQRTSGGKVDETEAPLLLKIQPITVPLTFTCMIAEPLPGCLGLVQLTLKLATTQNLRWSAELNLGFCF